jgi:hypothetical protein
MASLSKRQRRQVRAEISRAISPEWKLLERKEADIFLDVSSNGPGFLITSNITPGTGASNRIGDKIRIKRIEFWISTYSPSNPNHRGPIPCALLLYRRESTLTNYLGSIGALFDTALVPAPGYWEGRAPQVRDMPSRGIHVRKLRRWKMMGLPDRAVYVADTVSAISRTVGIESGVLDWTTTNPAGTSSGVQGAQNMVLPRQMKDSHVGHHYLMQRITVIYPGSGLEVGYENAGLGEIDTNQLYFLIGASVDNANGPTNKPTCSVAYRIYFTDS